MKNRFAQVAFQVILALTLLTLAAPAQAAPRQCDVSCTCSSSCNQPCSIGASIQKCGNWGVCNGSDECFAGLVVTQSSDALLSAIFLAPADRSAVFAPASR